MIPMIISCETADAEKALRLNLVHRVAPVAELDAAVDAVVRQFLTCGPTAVQEAKRLLRRLPALGYGAGLREAAALASKLFSGEEAAEGMVAFQSKRLPAWVPED
jgi:methylglutaconyl-CoA hydratase